MERSYKYYIGIVGGGFVGSATALLNCPGIKAITYDIDPSKCNPVGTTIHDLLSCDFTFVCVPTPSYESGECNTTIVEKCVASLKEAGVKNIVLRSTVPPGTCKKLDVMFMPEFLTEANWRRDFFECKQWIFGVRNSEEGTILQDMLRIAKICNRILNDNVLLVRTQDAEMIKYTRNNFLATKVAFFNEIASVCNAVDANYEMVRQGVSADPRIGSSHTAVPGPDGHKGFGGTCLPKDTNAFVYFAKEAGVQTPVVSAVVARNTTIDRPERDWESDARAFTKN
jgi:UDPglucose 6-dehydrogenase